MEPAEIDWENVVSRYVPDEGLEGIDAPMWVDLSNPDTGSDVDDDSFFCRPDCRHPKTYEDFLKLSPCPNRQKLLRSCSEKMPLGEVNIDPRDYGNCTRRRGGIGNILSAAATPLRDPFKQKRTSPASASKKKLPPDAENQNPNIQTASSWQYPAKGVFKQNIDKEAEIGEEEPPPAQQKQLKSVLSSRNMFSGKDILGQLSEFYSELKKLALGAAGSEEPVNSNDSKEKSEQTPSFSTPEKRKCVENALSVLREVRARPPSLQRLPSPSNTRIKHPKPAGTPVVISPLKNPPGSTPEKWVSKDMSQRKEGRRLVFAAHDQTTKSPAADGEGGSTALSSMTWFLKPCTHLVE